MNLTPPRLNAFLVLAITVLFLYSAWLFWSSLR